jgi:hypothetical protein
MDHRLPHFPNFHYNLLPAPLCEETDFCFFLGASFWENNKLWSSKHFIIESWHFPKRSDQALTMQQNRDKDASHFKDGQHCFGKLDTCMSISNQRMEPRCLRFQEKWVWVYYHMTINIHLLNESLSIICSHQETIFHWNGTIFVNVFS